MATKITTPELFNLSSNNTAATQLPVFTKSTRPTPTTSTVTVDYLVVGGGAGTYAGGGANYPGGGGAGGLRTSYGSTSGGGAVAEPSISLLKATSYNITVGQASLDGEDSVFGSITSLGGGRSGATASTAAGSSGGSGGGASGDAYNAAGGGGTANQGYSGGNSGPSCSGGGCRYPGGGGGGAASAGTNATTTTAGNGGDGLEVNIIGGTGNYYAGGGGGSSYISGAGTGGLGGGGNGSARSSGSEVVNNGIANTGGGGGGALTASSTPALGGSGVVILRYPTSSSLNIITTGSLVYTESTDGSDTVLQFTEGSGNFGFSANNITVGEMIFNSTTEKVEYWDGFQWNMIKDESQTILASENFNISAYTGTGGTATDTDITSVGFKPDFAWFKGDTNTYYHVLYDSIRGTNSAISTNNTNGNYSNYNRLQSFNNDGYSIRANNAGDLWKINRTGNSFIVYGWKGGDGFVSNSDGNISVNVSANPDAGFSIVTGNVGSGAKTFGTGLNQAPELVIGIPTVASTGGWGVWFKDWTTYQYMQINNTNALTTAASDLWNLSNWNTTGLMGVTSSMWGTNSPFVHYCFHSVAGYSKIDSFVGSGNSGNKQTTGFEPGWIMLKRTSPAGAGWYIIDNVRGANKYLSANSNGAEQTSGSNLVFESDGFSFTGSSFNFSGHEHIYIAIAT